jgi:hypothetical protein
MKPQTMAYDVTTAVATTPEIKSSPGWPDKSLINLDVQHVRFNMSGRIPGVFLCQLPGDADQQSLADHFLRTWGLYVQGIKLMNQLDGSCSALVDLDSQEDADQVRNGLLLLCC